MVKRCFLVSFVALALLATSCSDDPSSAPDTSDPGTSSTTSGAAFTGVVPTSDSEALALAQSLGTDLAWVSSDFSMPRLLLGQEVPGSLFVVQADAPSDGPGPTVQYTAVLQVFDSAEAAQASVDVANERAGTEQGKLFVSRQFHCGPVFVTFWARALTVPGATEAAQQWVDDNESKARSALEATSGPCS